MEAASHDLILSLIESSLFESVRILSLSCIMNLKVASAGDLLSWGFSTWLSPESQVSGHG